MTAVDWLTKELESYGDPIHLKTKWETFDELIKQTKEMEKEQIKNAWDNAAIDASYGKKYKNFEDYYNQLSNK